MKKCCEDKKKVRIKSEKELLIDRLNRINGQVNGIKKMVEEEKYCNDIIVQITAVNNSLKSLGLVLIEDHIKTCVKNDLIEGDITSLEELTKTLARFSK